MCIFTGNTVAGYCKHKQQILFPSIGRSLYTVQLNDKFEKVLKEVCWNDAYLILSMEDQYMVNWYNNATHIYCVKMHVVMVDMHKFLPW